MIEAMLESGKEMDRVQLTLVVLRYNNKIVECRTGSTQIISRDYYSRKVDWQALTLIEWR